MPVKIDGVIMERSGSHLRTCVGCRKVMERESLIRIVSSPEGLLAMDLKGRLPGRGAYVCCNTSCIQMATQNKALARVLKRMVEPSELRSLGQKVRSVLEERICSFLGILMKGKKIVIGRESIQKSFQKGEVHLLLQAVDVRDPVFSGTSQDVPVRVLLTRENLGRSIGKAPQPVLGIIDERACKKLIQLIDMQNRLE